MEASGSSVVNGTVYESIPELREPLPPPPVEESKIEVCLADNSQLS
jgi:hypothetical protein